MTNIQERLRSGLDNCDRDSEGLELGGVVLTMNLAADHIDALEKALEECEAEIDACVWQEYPGDHLVHESYRQRDFSANPARIALTELRKFTAK